MHVKTTKKKIALVTEANRGLGFETCKQLSQLGVTVLLTLAILQKVKLQRNN
jgi:NAD(P)-dependent dehydrogenase (short-subunit alcohol dehydrogenase family)